MGWSQWGVPEGLTRSIEREGLRKVGFALALLLVLSNHARADGYSPCTDYTYSDVKAASGNIICIAVDKDGNEKFDKSGNAVLAVIDRAEVLSRFPKSGNKSVVKWTPVSDLSDKEKQKYGNVSGPPPGGRPPSGFSGGGGFQGGGGSGGFTGGAPTSGENYGGGGRISMDGSGPNLGGGSGSRGGIDYSGKGSGRGSRGGGNASSDLHTSAQNDAEKIADLCAQSGDSRIDNAIDKAKSEQEDTDTQLKKYQSKDDPDYIDLKSEQHQAAMSCRSEYVTLALSADDSCSWKNLGVNGQVSFCAYLANSDTTTNDNALNSALQTFLSSGDQDACSKVYGQRSPDDQLFALMMKNKACAASLVKKQSDNNLSCQALVDFVADQQDFNSLVARKKNLAAKAGSSCAVNRSSDAMKFTDDKLATLSVDCLTNIASTCDTALTNAARVLASLPPTYCVECNQRGNSLYSNNGNGTGVSKAAQIISAIGNAVVPLGLGVMNMISYNKGLAACVSTYNAQVQQASVVGLPPQSSNCGISSGMSGYGGISGMSGVGGYSPYGGTSGMSGGYSPYGSMGSAYGSSGYSPYGGMGTYGMSAGIGISGLSGLGYSGYGSSLYGMGGYGSSYPSLSAYGSIASAYGYGSGMGSYGYGVTPSYSSGMSGYNPYSASPYSSGYNPYASYTNSSNPYSYSMGGYGNYGSSFGGYGSSGYGSGLDLSAGLSLNLGGSNAYGSSYGGANCYYTYGIPCN